MADLIGEGLVNIRVNVNGLAQVAQLRTQLNTLGNRFQNLGRVLRGSSEEFENYITRVRRSSFVLRDAGRQLTLFGAGLAGAFAAVAVVGAKFEQALVEATSVLGDIDPTVSAGQAKIESLKETILDLAATTRFSATEIAKGVEKLALAGFDTRQVEGLIGQITQLAQASTLAVSDTAQIVGQIIRSYQLDAIDATRVTDVLTATFTNANVTLTTLGESFKLVAPTASAFGISIEEVATAIGLLGDAGLQGSIAGTSLNRLLVQLASNSEKVSEILVRAGSSADAVDPLKNSLRDIVAEFERLIVSGRITTSTLAKTFDQRAVRALLNLVNQGSARFDELNAKLEASVGLTEEISNIRIDTVYGQWRILVAAVEALGVALSDLTKSSVKEFLSGLAEQVAQLTELIRNLTPAQQEFVNFLSETVLRFAALTIGIGLFLQVAGKVKAIWAAVLLSFRSGGVIFGFFNRIVEVLRTNMLLSTAAALGLRTALVALTGGLGLVLSLIWLFPDAFSAVWTWLKRITGFAPSIEEEREALAKYKEEFDNLKGSAESASKQYGKFFVSLTRINELLGKGGTISKAQIQDLSRLLKETGIKSGQDINNQIKQAIRQQNELTQRLNALKDQAIEETGTQSDVIKKDIKEVENAIARIGNIIEELTTARDQFDIFENIGASAGQSLEDFKKGIEDQKTQASTDLAVLDASLGAQRTAEEQAQVDAARARVNTFAKQLQILSNFTEKSFRAFVDAYQQTGTFDAAIEAAARVVEEEQKLIDKTEKLREKAKEAAKDLAKLIEALDDFGKSALEKKLEEFEGYRQRLERNIRDLSQNDLGIGELTALFETYADLLGDIQEEEERFLKSESKERKSAIRDVALANAREKKDLAEIVRLTREARDEQLAADLEDKFQVPVNPTDQQQINNILSDRNEYQRQYNEETDNIIENLKKEHEEQNKTKEAEADKTLKTSERNELEKSIAQQLIEQVNSLKDAQAVSEFIRAEQRRRFREAEAYDRQRVRAEQRLFTLVRRRAELEAKGQDTTLIDKQIAFAESAARVRGLISNVAVGQIGAPTDVLPPADLAVRLKKVRDEAEEALKSATFQVEAVKVVADLLEDITVAFNLAPKGWVQALIDSWNEEVKKFNPTLRGNQPQGAVAPQPALPNPVPVNPQVNPARIPGLDTVTQNTTNDNRQVNITINGAGQDAEQLAATIRRRLAENQFA